MKSTFTHITLLIILVCSLSSQAQKPAPIDYQVGYRKTYYGGLQLHTHGWGATFSYSTFKTHKNKSLLNVEFVSMKHPKEYKRSSNNDTQAKSYAYGKQYSLSILRLNKGHQTILYEKLRKQGIEISLNTKYGVSLGFIKPVYLEILRLKGNRIETFTEKYDPTIHNTNNIYGRSSNLVGLSETTIVPGGHINSSFLFEFSSEREQIKSIEVGIAIDVFYKEIPLMARTENSFIYPSAYLNFQFGKKKI